MPRLGVSRSGLRRAWSRARGWIERCGADVALRERALATASFAAIFAFSLIALDQIVTGQADWHESDGQAYAMSSAPRSMSNAQSVDAPALTPIASESSENVTIFEVDYSFTDEVLLGGPDDPYALAVRRAKELEAGTLAIYHSATDTPLKPGAS